MLRGGCTSYYDEVKTDIYSFPRNSVSLKLTSKYCVEITTLQISRNEDMIYTALTCSYKCTKTLGCYEIGLGKSNWNNGVCYLFRKGCTYYDHGDVDIYSQTHGAQCHLYSQDCACSVPAI